MTFDQTHHEDTSADAASTDPASDQEEVFEGMLRPVLPITQTDAWIEERIREERRRRAQLNS